MMLYSTDSKADTDIKENNINDEVSILIIDDDKSIRNLLKIYIKNLGYNVVEADNGENGLELYAQYDFDLVMVDYVMPVMDGLEFLKKSKEIDKQNCTPILILTGSEDKESHSECFDNGADDIVLKPFQEHILKIKIESWLRTKHNLDEIEAKKKNLLIRDFQHEEDLLISQKVINNFTYFDKEKIRNIRIFEQAKEILSGDMVLSAISPSGNQNILLADFTGHGLPAAIGSMMVSELFYAMTKKGISIVEISLEINKKLRCVLPTNRFMAACMVEINYNDNVASVIQAGLPDMYIFNGENELLHTIESKHVPLGVLSTENLDIQVERFNVDKGTKIFIYTDGLNEAKNKQDKIFGKERIIDAIKESYVNFSSFEEVKNVYKEFMDGYHSFDDLTFIQIISDQSLISKNDDNSDKGIKRTPAKWSMSVSFDMNIMRELDPIPSLVNQIVDIQGIHISREKLYLVLTELYSNSLEHGILGLDSTLKKDTKGFAEYYELRQQRLHEISDGKIEIHFHHSPTSDGGSLTIVFTDNGQGFDQTTINPDMTHEQIYKGRGISLINSLTNNYHYEDNGRKAHLELCWDKAA